MFELLLYVIINDSRCITEIEKCYTIQVIRICVESSQRSKPRYRWYWPILYSNLKYKIKLLLRPIVDPKVRTREKHVRPIRNNILWDIPCYLRSWIQGHQDAILLHNTRFFPLPWGICKQIREKTYSFLGPSH